MTIRLPLLSLATALAVLPLSACVTSSGGYRPSALLQELQRALEAGPTSPAVKAGCVRALSLLEPHLPNVASVLDEFSGPTFGIVSFGSEWLSWTVVAVGSYHGHPTLYYQDSDLSRALPISREEAATISLLLSTSKDVLNVPSDRLHQSCHLVFGPHGEFVPVTLSDDPSSQRSSDKAVLMIDKIVESAPNSSFKPSPLRGLGQNPPFSGGPA